MKPDPMLALFSPGGTEIILMRAVALLLFGGKKLPELARGLDQGIKEFKQATGSASEELRHAIEKTLPAASRHSPPAPTGTECTISPVASDAKI